MSKNELIPTNGAWYKIKVFLKKIFFRLKKVEESTTQLKYKENNFDSFLLKDEIKEKNIQNELANKLINQKISVVDLTEKEIDTMLEYFKKLIKEKNSELDRIFHSINKD